MEWIILFGASWLLFFLLVDYKALKKNVLSGVLAIVLQMSVDTNAMKHSLYRIQNPGIGLFGSSVFFILGPVFVIGVLMTQFHPQKRWMNAANVFTLSTLYTCQEIFLLSTGALKYLNWDLIDSAVVNIAAMMILSWFSMTVLKKEIKR